METIGSCLNNKKMLNRFGLLKTSQEEVADMAIKSIVLSILLSIVAVFGVEAAGGKENLGTFSLYFENDLFANTDQGYTNGIKLSWISPDLTGYAESGKLPDWSLPYVRWLPFINEPGFQRNVALCMGQNIYTPENISREDLIEDDRPYAGWAYLGIAFHSKNERRLDTTEFQLGIVGPPSGAEPTQKFVHRLRDIQRPNGWDNQLKNEPGLAYSFLLYSLFGVSAPMYLIIWLIPGLIFAASIYFGSSPNRVGNF